MPRFFSPNKTNITTSLTFLQASAYTLWLVEEYATGKMSESKYNETLFRLLAMLGFAVVGYLLTCTAQKLNERCQQQKMSASNLETQPLIKKTTQPATAKPPRS